MAQRARIEADSMEAVEIPTNRCWGAQTRRLPHNFDIGHNAFM